MIYIIVLDLDGICMVHQMAFWPTYADSLRSGRTCLPTS